MIAGGGVNPFSGPTFCTIAQADEHGSARIVPDIADLPPGAMAATVG
jgi:hypothetical protein